MSIGLFGLLVSGDFEMSQNVCLKGLKEAKLGYNFEDVNKKVTRGQPDTTLKF